MDEETGTGGEGGECSWADIPCHLESFAGWLLDLVLWIPRKMVQMFCDAFATLFEAIPVPDFISNITSAWGGFPSGSIYFLDAFQVGYGFSVIITAYLIRFVIRRIPLFG